MRGGPWKWEFECEKCGGVGRTTVTEVIGSDEGCYRTEKECTECEFSATYEPGESNPRTEPESKPARDYDGDKYDTLAEACRADMPPRL
jgi:hypothetical protein